MIYEISKKSSITINHYIDVTEKHGITFFILYIIDNDDNGNIFCLI